MKTRDLVAMLLAADPSGALDCYIDYDQGRPGIRIPDAPCHLRLVRYDEPPDTLPAPPEPATSPGTPAARRRSSDSMQAVKGDGLAARVAAELAKGKA